MDGLCRRCRGGNGVGDGIGAACGCGLIGASVMMAMMMHFCLCLIGLAQQVLQQFGEGVFDAGSVAAAVEQLRECVEILPDLVARMSVV